MNARILKYTEELKLFTSPISLLIDLSPQEIPDQCYPVGYDGFGLFILWLIDIVVQQEAPRRKK